MKNFVGGDSLDVVLQIIKSLIKLIVLIARVDIFFLIFFKNWVKVDLAERKSTA